MAAEVLIRLDEAGSYRKGAIIAVKPGGWVWGTEEQTNRFVRVTVVDAQPADLEQYLGDYRVGEGDNKQLLNKRLYYMESAAVDNVAAQPSGNLATTKASVDAVMRNIIDNG